MRIARTLAELAAAEDEEWILCLFGGAEPEPDALRRLQAHAAPLVAGAVRDGSGALVEAWLPKGTEVDPDRVVAAAPQRILPVVRATLAHTLVRGALLREHGPPDPRHGAHAADVWTARVLRDEPGVFVPAAVARIARAPRPEPGGPIATWRAARTGAWGRYEQMRRFQQSLTRRL